jgi:hypothetical protein
MVQTNSIENSILLSEIALLMSVDAEDSISWHTAAVKELAVSENFEVRTNAIETLSNLGLAGEIPDAPYRELGIAYAFYLPANDKFRHIEKIEPFENIKDTDDYLKIIRSHQYWLDFLARVTGFAKENIAHRWITLMNEKTDPSLITQIYEKEFQQHLRNLALNFPFQRPRIAAVQIGLDYLLTELIDAETLDFESIGSYSSIDPYLESNIRVNQRPQFVIALSDAESSFLGEDWVDQIDHTKRASDGLLIFGDNLVISEFSFVKRLDWGMPVETYSTNCRIVNSTGVKSKDDAGNVYDCYYRDYFNTQYIPDDVLVISNNCNFDFHLGFLAKWIAFNPKVATSLNWKPSKKADFAWENMEEDLMAYSVYWRSGNIYMSSTHFKESEVAEGWYVVLTLKGKQKIKERNTQFVLKKEISRDWFYESKKSKEISIEVSVTL